MKEAKMNSLESRSKTGILPMRHVEVITDTECSRSFISNGNMNYLEFLFHERIYFKNLSLHRLSMHVCEYACFLLRFYVLSMYRRRKGNAQWQNYSSTSKVYS